MACSVAGLEPLPEMEALDAEPLAEVEPVRGFAGHARDQLKLRAPRGPPFRLQPLQEPRPVAAGTHPLVSDEVINREDAAAVEHRQEAVAGDRAHEAVLDEGRQAIAVTRH